MGAGLLSIAAFFAAAILFVIAVVAGWWLLVRVFSFIGAVVAHIWRWIAGTVSDLLRIVGAAIVAVVFVPLALANIIVGRWSAAAHYGRALSSELHTIGAAFYRVAIGHPARLLGLARVVEGLERRLPHAVAQAPTSDKPKKASGLFEGYTIVGSLKGGGSGGKLYIAAPDAMKQAGFERRGYADCDRVVIKTFSLTDGSSLPQIVRESRALDAARKMGLVLEHQLTDERFYYVMRYVPGESLATVTQNLHAESAPVPRGGLDDDRLRIGVGYVADLLEGLDVYHSGGLWHKDVKPDNIIIDPQQTEGDRAGGRAHLVDFGLITPLRSAMTLTTHGTEYFRDPELVRMALRGVKVHQIDGA
ncbi:MAG: serine/threonine-protein kinase, partial [Planctomycetota bacterium]